MNLYSSIAELREVVARSGCARFDGGLVVTRPDDAVVLLDNLLKDPDEPPDVYRHAVSALKRLDLPAASAALTRHAQHAKPMVAQWAMKALGSAN